MQSKEQRQKKIQDMITRHNISTQSELVNLLQEEGYKVTQATISRDINEMRLVRLPIGKGKHRYAMAQYSTGDDLQEQMVKIFQNFVRNINQGENILVIHTSEGHASGVARLLDALQRNEIIGTLAGTDTILVIARTTKEAEALMKELNALMRH